MEKIPRSVLESVVDQMYSYNTKSDNSAFEVPFKRTNAELLKHSDAEYVDVQVLNQIVEEFQDMYTLPEEEICDLNVHTGAYQISEEIIQDKLPE